MLLKAHLIAGNAAQLRGNIFVLIIYPNPYCQTLAIKIEWAPEVIQVPGRAWVMNILQCKLPGQVSVTAKFCIPIITDSQEEEIGLPVRRIKTSEMPLIEN